MDKKLKHIQQNGTLAKPDPTPTQFTEQEVNDYLASGHIQLPAGVKSVRVQGQPDLITGHARVDFDQLRNGQKSSNPLLSIFTGIHDVAVIAHARGMGGQGYVEVSSVSLDDVEIPRFALQLFVDKYIQPKYPNVGLNSRFAMSDRIDTATVDLHKLTVTQK